VQSSVRSSVRRLPSLKVIKLSPSQKVNFSKHAPKMTLLFPRFQEFSPLFRLADELDRAARGHQTHGASTRSFAPRFDVKETKEAYELNGELPGIDQSDVNIEWSDESTLTISGHTERITKSTNAAPEAPETEFEVVTPESTEEQSDTYHKPTVEDEDAEASSTKATEGAATTVTKADKKPVAKTSEKSRYWVTERSFGNFNRTFQFPSRVDHDGVKASMKNGVLQVLVPKAKALEPRRVVIN